MIGHALILIFMVSRVGLEPLTGFNIGFAMHTKLRSLVKTTGDDQIAMPRGIADPDGSLASVTVNILMNVEALDVSARKIPLDL